MSFEISKVSEGCDLSSRGTWIKRRRLIALGSRDIFRAMDH
ncbi:hypothetical protein SAMN05216284_11886 [Micromonospora sediminimaris]|nr:hypothetical protein SAMN05216284_11886 [Micromonospora sediminimaris]